MISNGSWGLYNLTNLEILSFRICTLNEAQKKVALQSPYFRDAKLFLKSVGINRKIKWAIYAVITEIMKKGIFCAGKNAKPSRATISLPSLL